MKRLIVGVLMLSTVMNAQADSLDTGIFKLGAIFAGAYAGNKLSNGSTLGSIAGAVAGGYVFDKYQESQLASCPKVDPYAVPPNPYTNPEYRCGRYQ